MTEYQKSEFEKDIKLIADHYGFRNQLAKLWEESGELEMECMKASIAHLKGEYFDFYRERLIDEMADVSIMIAQVIYLMGAEEEVQDRMRFKIQRQFSRMEGEE